MNIVLDIPPMDDYLERQIEMVKSHNWQLKNKWNMDQSLDFYIGYYNSLLLIIGNVSEELKNQYINISLDLLLIIDKKRNES
jgi:hypothetical protein